MATTSFLLAAIGAVVVVLTLVHIVAWRLVRAAVLGAPYLVPRLSGSRFWQRGAPLRTRTAARFPRGYGLMAARFSLDRFSGLALTLVVVALVYIVVVAGGLVDTVHKTQGAVRLDQTVDAFFTPYRAAWLLKAFLWITAISAGPALAAILACATALLWSGGRADMISPVWIAFVGAQATTWSSKYVIARPRPEFLPDITEWNPSFPSGHATASTALIGILGYVVAAGLPSLRARFEVGYGTVLVIGLVCFSRLFLGVHFLTDVAAGILVGVFWLLVGYTAAALRRPGPNGGG